MKKKQFFEALVKTEYIYPYSGKVRKVFQLYYLPDNHKYINILIDETDKNRAWKKFKNQYLKQK